MINTITNHNLLNVYSLSFSCNCMILSRKDCMIGHVEYNLLITQVHTDV